MSPLAAKVSAARDFVEPPAMSPEKEAAFDRFCVERGARLGRQFAILCVTFNVLWAPTDYLVYRELPDVIASTQLWRVLSTLVACGYLLLARLPTGRRRVFDLFAVTGLLLCCSMGFASALQGGPDKPFIHLLYMLVFGTVPLPLRLPRRVALTVAFAIMIVTGYVIRSPSYLASPYLLLVLSFLSCVIALSVLFGHLLFLLMRENFWQAAQLEENNQLLEQRVEERTAELRDLLSRLESTREEERSRIAREVHDQLGQELTAQRLTLAIAEECLDGEPVTARKKLVEMRHLLDQMMVTVRALIADLRPWILHDMGLGEAAQWLARRTEELSGLRCKLTVTGDPTKLDAERSTAVFRILQESLNNVTKHAHATEVEIELDASAEAVALRVADDGAGPSGKKGGRSFGVLGMRERAHALGGDFSMHGPPRGGTEVTCRLPLRNGPGGTP